jgi:alpha-1,2-mannosyltransferase
MLALWQHGVIANGTSHTSSDFVSFYAAGKLALAGTPALAYDQAAHFLMEQRFTVEGAPYQFFFYPPVFLMLPCRLAAAAVLRRLLRCSSSRLMPSSCCTMRAILREPGWAWIGPSGVSPRSSGPSGWGRTRS